MVKITRHKTGTFRDLGFLTVSVFFIQDTKRSSSEISE